MKRQCEACLRSRSHVLPDSTTVSHSIRSQPSKEQRCKNLPHLAHSRVAHLRRSDVDCESHIHLRHQIAARPLLLKSGVHSAWERKYVDICVYFAPRSTAMHVMSRLSDIDHDQI